MTVLFQLTQARNSITVPACSSANRSRTGLAFSAGQLWACRRHWHVHIQPAGKDCEAVKLGTACYTICFGCIKHHSPVPRFDAWQSGISTRSKIHIHRKPQLSHPPGCIICEDERQYVGLKGQKWIDREELQRSHRNVLRKEEPEMLGIGTEPSFAIGQRALLIQTGDGNVLWDCINVLTPETVKEIRSRGGIQAIAISHPHFYTGMAAWAEEFDAPVYIHAKDRQWVTEPCSKIQYWEGDEKELFGGARLLRLGGHFPGSAVLHWEKGAGGKGVLCTGDTIQGILDKRWVSFMYSYPNLIPLPAEQVARIGHTVKTWPYSFEHLYAGWFGKGVEKDAQEAVFRSAERYIGILDGSLKKEYW